MPIPPSSPVPIGLIGCGGRLCMVLGGLLAADSECRIQLRADLLTGHIETRRIGWNTETVVSSVRVAPLAGIREGIQSAVSSFAIDQAQEEGRVVDVRPLWEAVGETI